MALTAPAHTEKDATLRARPDETPAAFAIRCIRAETWDEAIHHVEGSLFTEVKRAAMRDNPYRDFRGTQTEGTDGNHAALQTESDVTCGACGRPAYERDGSLLHRDSSLDPSPIAAQGHRVIPPVEERS